MKGEFYCKLPNFGKSVNVSINENKVCYSYLANNKIEAFNHNFLYLIVTFILLDDAEIKVRKTFQISLKYIGCVPRC